VVPPSSRGISRVPRYSNPTGAPFRLRGFHPLWPATPRLFGYNTPIEASPPEGTCGLFRVRSPLLAESRLISFPPGTEMFHFPGFAPQGLCIQPRVTGIKPDGLPHSGISGSKPACGSPKLNAACHALHRLQMPRHPPCALSNLAVAKLHNPTKELVHNTTNHEKTRRAAPPPLHRQHYLRPAHPALMTNQGDKPQGSHKAKLCFVFFADHPAGN
jgi:hypothetical protein